MGVPLPLSSMQNRPYGLPAASWGRPIGGDAVRKVAKVLVTRQRNSSMKAIRERGVNYYGAAGETGVSPAPSGVVRATKKVSRQP
jgi:hypothetical protein